MSLNGSFRLLVNSGTRIAYKHATFLVAIHYIYCNIDFLFITILAFTHYYNVLAIASCLFHELNSGTT